MTGRDLSKCMPAMAVLLTACGGSGTDVASTPAPPAGSTFTYATLATAGQSQSLAAQAVVLTSSRSASASVPTVTANRSQFEVSYDPTTKTYALRGTPTTASSKFIEQSFGPANQVAGLPGNYDKTTVNGNTTTINRLFVSTTLTYTGFGQWDNGSTADGAQNFDTYYFVYGIRTQQGDLPKSGSASYALQLTGSAQGATVTGTGSLTADFGAGTVGVSIAPGYRYRAEQTVTPFATLTGNGQIDSSANTFASTLAGGGYSGAINGAFFGPQAAEAGGAFTVAGSDGSVAAAGVAIGKRN
jgi:hypothetical protein